MESAPTSHSESPAKLHAESPLRQFSVDQLHQELVRYENEELVYDQPELCPTIDIVDDRAIEVESHHIELSELRTFMFNGLRLNQGYPMTAEDFHDHGFRGTASTLKINMQWLMKAMALGSSEKFIEQEQPVANGEAEYTLLPEVRIIDWRDEQQLTPAERLLKECGAVDSDGEIRMRENGSIDFAAPRFRARVNLAMLKEYREAAQVDYAIAQLFDLRMGHRSLSDPILPVRYYKPLEPEETMRIMAAKEQSLLTYLQVLVSQADPSEQQQQTIIAGVQACYELFARNMDLAAKNARIHAGSIVPYHELYQEAAMLLMEAVVVEGYDSTGLHNFRFVATEMMKHYKGHGMYRLYHFSRQPVNHPIDYSKDRPRFVAAAEELEAELGYTPGAAEIAKRMGARMDKVLGMMALGLETFRLDHNHDNEDDREYVPPEFHDHDFSDRVLEQMEQKAAIENIFSSDKLTTAEKVVLSLYYQIFQPNLCGVAITEGKATFCYPETFAEFTALTTKQRTLHSLSLDVFGFYSHFAINRHENALRKARALLESDTSFDGYGLADTAEARHIAEQAEVERRQIVTCALTLSPHERLGRKELEALFKTGDLPYSVPRITKLFGTIIAFQEACGFEPDKRRANRTLDADEVIKRALQLKPDGPMTASDIRAFSKQDKFAGYGVVRRLFGTLSAFQEACGFTPVAQAKPRQDTT